MMTPQETKSGIATAELNNIPTYRKGVKVFPLSKSSNTCSRGGVGFTWMDGEMAPMSCPSVTPKNSVNMTPSNWNPVPLCPADPSPNPIG